MRSKDESNVAEFTRQAGATSDCRVGRRSTLRYRVGCALALGAAIVATQLVLRAYTCELAGQHDEAAHFTTGVMVYDYLRTSLGSDPIAFAEQYYVRYPNVAFGHWPPVFYLVQACWYFAFGASKVSAMLLMGTITATAAYVLHVRLSDQYGWFISLLATVMFLWLPLVRRSSSFVMADMLVCLFCVLAVFRYSDFLRTAAWKPLVAFLFWTCLAILTKGNAFALMPLMFLAPLLAARGNNVIWKKTGLVLLGAIALTVPYYLVASIAGLDPHADPSKLIRFAASAHERLWIVGRLLSLASPVVFVLAGLAIVARIRKPESDSSLTSREVDVSVAAAWVLSVTLFQILCYITGATRYLLIATPALAVLFAHALHWIRSDLCGRRPALASMLCVLVTFGALATVGGVAPRLFTGTAAVATSIPNGFNEPVVLLSSRAPYEGAFVVERLVRDKDRSGIVLRADKVLSSSKWSGREYELLFETVDEVRDYLLRVPVHYVVLDNAAFLDFATPAHHDLLQKALRDDTSFAELARYSLVRYGQRRPNSMVVYQNLRAQGRKPSLIEIDMRHSLGRVLQLRLDLRHSVSTETNPTFLGSELDERSERECQPEDGEKHRLKEEHIDAGQRRRARRGN